MKLELTETFVSVQGESTWAGFPTFFVRLARCNLRCRWCDTSYSFSRGSDTSFEAIFSAIEQSGLRHVCITGGEPLLQTEIFSFMAQLCDMDYLVNLETSGAQSIAHVDARVKKIVDVKCPGSLMEKHFFVDNLRFLTALDELKFVIADHNDFCYAVDFLEKNHLPHIVVNFSPVFGELDPRELTEWILAARLPVRLNLQCHKYIWEPSLRGV